MDDGQLSNGNDHTHATKAQYSHVAPENPNTRGWMFWTLISLCSTAEVAVIIVGIVKHVYWLGILSILAFVPSLVILWMLYWRKHYEKAQLNRVAKYLLIGMIGVIPILVVEFALQSGFGEASKKMQGDVPIEFSEFFASFTSSIFVAALVEETFKFIVASRVTFSAPRDCPYSVVIYSMSGALGLATLENFLYVVVSGLTGSIETTVFTVLFRGLLAVPLHATTATIIGVDVARNKINTQRKNVLLILLIPFIIHGLYDFCILFAVNYSQDHDSAWIFSLGLISVGAVMAGIFYAYRQTTRLLQENHAYSLVSDELSEV